MGVSGGKDDRRTLTLFVRNSVPREIIGQKTDRNILALRLTTLDAGRADEVRARLQDAENKVHTK